MANVGAFVHSIRANEYVCCVKQEKVDLQGAQNNDEKVHKTMTGRYTKQESDKTKKGDATLSVQSVHVKISR